MPNYIPDSSFEDVAKNWYSTGPASLSQVSVANAVDGPTVGQLTMTGSGTPSCRPLKYIAVEPGQEITFSCYLRKVSGTFTDARINLHYYQFDGNTSAFGSDTGSAQTIAVAPNWTRIVNKSVVPADTVSTELRLVLVSGVLNDVMQFDAAMLEPGFLDTASPYVKREDELSSAGSISDQTDRWLRSSNITKGTVADKQLRYLELQTIKKNHTAALQSQLGKKVRYIIRKSDYV